MRKKLILLLILLSVSLGVTFFCNPTSIYADANGYLIENVVTEKFNKDTVNSDFKLNGSEQVLDYYGMHCVSPVSYGCGPIINGFTLSKKTTINFTIYPESADDTANLSFNIGIKYLDGYMHNEDATKGQNVDCKIQLWNSQLTYSDYHNPYLNVDSSKVEQHVLRDFTGLYTDLVKTDVSIIVEVLDSTTKIYVEYYRNDEEVYSSKDKAFVLDKKTSGYCGFFWDSVEMNLTNFSAYNENGDLLMQDDFSSNTLTYTAQDASTGNFHVNKNSVNESSCYISKNNIVKMDSANESIIHSYGLTKQTKVTYPYEINASLRINEFKNNSFVGFGFGLSDSDTKIDAKNAIGFILKDSYTANIVVVRNGVIDKSDNYSISLSKLGINKYQDYTIKFDNNNNVYFTVCGSTFNFSNINFTGNVGVGLVDLGSTASSSCDLKYYSLKKNTYSGYDTEDVSNDFKGIKEPEDITDIEEPYLNSQKYFLGRGVELFRWKDDEPAQILFSEANAYSGFGYKKKYSEFICEFDIDIKDISTSQSFGLSFGRQSIMDSLVQASTSNNAYFLRYEKDNNVINTAQYTYGSDCKFSDGSNYQSSACNIFNSTSDVYHMMFIAKNRNLYVYYKGENDPDSDLSILRAVMTDVNTDGYVAVVGNGGASFSVNSFKIVNLLDDCTTESELTIRESFTSKDSVSSGLNIDALSNVENGCLILNNSNCKTKDKYLYEIIRFTTESVDGSLKISFSNDKNIVFDVKNNKISIKDNGNVTDYDCGSMNISYIGGKRFEITIFGDTITISYKKLYDPQDKLSVPVITHTIDSEAPLSKDEITIRSTGKSEIDDLYIFALDNSKKCATYNYEDDKDNGVTWLIKSDFDASKVYKENKNWWIIPTIIGSILIVGGGIATIILVKRGKKNEKDN